MPNQLTKTSQEVLSTTTADITTITGKMQLAEEMLAVPQTKVTVVHRFGPGIYIREATYPAGQLIVGLEHTSEHLNVLLKGEIRVIAGDGKIAHLVAPFMFTAPAGSKVGYTLTEVVWQNIYATTETDIEVIEATIFKAPEMWNKHLQQKLVAETPLHEEDREDFLAAITEFGCMNLTSHSREDCIPFPYGSYAIISGESPIQGKGMFATKDFIVGETIAPMRLTGKYTPAGYLINHSKTPNCKGVVASNNDLYLLAIKPINGMIGGEVGEELTLDYRKLKGILT